MLWACSIIAGMSFDCTSISIFYIVGIAFNDLEIVIVFTEAADKLWEMSYIESLLFVSPKPCFYFYNFFLFSCIEASFFRIEEHIDKKSAHFIIYS